MLILCGDFLSGYISQNGFESFSHEKKDQDNLQVSKEKRQEESTMMNLDSTNLFQRVPILRSMFIEVILSQCLSSVLNFQFMVKVKEAIVDDQERASWTGRVSVNLLYIYRLFFFCFLHYGY